MWKEKHFVKCIIQDLIYDKLKKYIFFQVLNLENNQIATIPSEISQLENLWQLYLKSNKIQFLPDAFTKLSSLEELHLTDNHLRCLPNCLEGLSSLKQLYLAHNKLRFLPLSVINLHQLQVRRVLWYQMSRWSLNSIKEEYLAIVFIEKLKGCCVGHSYQNVSKW